MCLPHENLRKECRKVVEIETELTEFVLPWCLLCFVTCRFLSTLGKEFLVPFRRALKFSQPELVERALAVAFDEGRGEPFLLSGALP